MDFRAERAYRACTSRLWVNGVPRTVMFCDGSRQCDGRKGTGSSGGYGILLRDPWATNVEGSDNRERAAAESAAGALPFGFEWREGFGTLHVALQLVETNRPATFLVELFTDSQESWHKIDRSLNCRAERFLMRHIAPVMRAIIWMTWRLRELGCQVKIRSRSLDVLRGNPHR
ncbi:hypothetical protein B0T20DRAFT_442680 [Sordaria brevicollis]|uniref:RNase H type-1 domain-containing protein n=1 Tax=Sordaria brevicollis TaxID=83679 RepID=A0AAE0UAH8_SORBR|nr:hypothetical protein B0T20DRAFT_442680 [Sordaria brevicollis]